MEIQSLTVSERIILAEALWDSVVAEGAEIELTDAQKLELDQRLKSLELDQDRGSSWGEVKARILSK